MCRGGRTPLDNIIAILGGSRSFRKRKDAPPPKYQSLSRLVMSPRQPSLFKAKIQLAFPPATGN